MSARALFVAAAALAPLPAAAQSVTAQSAFTTDEAARCGVVFARMADALAESEGAPDVLVAQVAVALPVWEYELIASAPGREDVLNAAVSDAIGALLAAMPDGEDAASERGDYLLAQAQACGAMIDAAYPDARHPVVAEMRQVQAEGAQAEGVRAEGVQAEAVPVPSPKPEEKPKRRKGLR